MIRFKGPETKFQKRQRLSIYKAALKHFKKNNSDYDYDEGLCYVINEVTDSTSPGRGNFSDILRYFPEIMKRKPKDANFWWFPNSKQGKNKRVNLLKAAIKELEDAKQLTSLRRKHADVAFNKELNKLANGYRG